MVNKQQEIPDPSSLILAPHRERLRVALDDLNDFLAEAFRPIRELVEKMLDWLERKLRMVKG